MKKTTMILSSVLVLSLGAASLASAAGMQHGKGKGMGPRGMNIEQMFEDLDVNKDGQLTKEEIQAAGQARFKAADTDGDGFLSADELKAAAEKRAAERTAKRGDRTAKMLEKLDADKDGKLSFEEMEAGKGKGRGDDMGRGKGHGKGHGENKGRGEGRDGGDRAMRMFEHADANEDGFLTLEEVQDAMSKMGKGRRGGKDKG